MAYKNLREFMARLEHEGEMKRIQADADVDLEITEITDRVSKSGGPALFFENPRSAKDGIRYSTPLLINTLGSKRRLELALDVSSIEQAAGRIGLFDRERQRIDHRLAVDVEPTGEIVDACHADRIFRPGAGTERASGGGSGRAL